MSFKIGDKVRARDSELEDRITLLRKGKVYTVIEVEPKGSPDTLLLTELNGPWMAYRFEIVTEPVVDTEQSIASGVFVVVDKEYEDTIIQAFGTALDALKAANEEEHQTAYFMPYGAYKGWEVIK